MRTYAKRRLAASVILTPFLISGGLLIASVAAAAGEGFDFGAGGNAEITPAEQAELGASVDAAVNPPSKWFRLVPECATTKGEPGKPPPVPSLVCALQTFGNIAQIILGVTGSFALLMFVYGGFLLVTSAGSQEKVSQGKKVITNAVIGIFIIMCSGLLIQYALGTIQLSEGYKAIGLKCNPNLPENKQTVATGTGQYIQLKTGQIICVKPGTGCQEKLKSYGFSCMDATADPTKYCIANLCPPPRNNMCCYTPPPGG